MGRAVDEEIFWGKGPFMHPKKQGRGPLHLQNRRRFEKVEKKGGPRD